MENTVKKIKCFEDLNSYTRARELTCEIYSVTKNTIFSKDFGLRDQIRRAAVSILSNIAEGFERGSKAEFIQFLYISKSSCGEVRAQLAVAYDQGYIDKKSYEKLVSDCRRISGMLGNLIKYLLSSDLSGVKHKVH